MTVETRPIPELNPEEAVQREVQQLRERLKNSTGDEYQRVFDAWEGKLSKLAQLQPIDATEGGVFRVELPGDFRSVNVILRVMEEWLRRGLVGPAYEARINDFVTVAGEFANNIFEHGIALKDPVSEEMIRKPSGSVNFGLALIWRDGKPGVEFSMETVGKIASPLTLEELFEREVTQDDDVTTVTYTPKEEDFVPDLDRYLAKEGGMGLGIAKSLMERGRAKLVIQYDNERNPEKYPVHHTTTLIENLAA